MTWIPSVFTLALRRFLSYRADFWLHFAGTSLVQILISYALWSALFRATGQSTLGGFTFEALVFYSVLAPLVDSFISMNFSVIFSEDIYRGTLTRYLLLPANVFLYKYIEHLSHITLSVFKILPALGLYFLFFDLPSTVHITPAGIFATLGLLVIGSSLYFLMICAVEMIAFWAENVWSLTVFLRFLLQYLGGLYIPLSLVPEGPREWLLQLPFAHFFFVPLQIFMGQVPPATARSSAGVLLLWMALTGGLLALGWTRGRLRYTGAGQ